MFLKTPLELKLAEREEAISNIVNNDKLVEVISDIVNVF